MYQTSYYRSPFGDTTFTKVFVGGLAWETPAAEMRRYFDQFGEILEAVIITDKNTGKSKGYGFVTFQEADSATRAVAAPNPVIDGRKANCNIASFGRPRPSPPRGRGQTGSPSPYQSGGPSAYTGMAAPLPPASAAHQLMYPSYGYTYNPDQFRYHQHQRFTSPPLLVYPSSSPFSSPLQGLLSSSEESEAPQQVSAKVEATTAPESTSSKEPTSS
ncbi:hypothetical protein IGI04_027860 [Brassica rapa subsp. trilocularis]|uniref:RRM domain-containing protein n=1 Tax=Brassica rapa subsp. trilocularis TaxID=1813537 RepID=A0ABQ7L0A7_BRACM|nr:hypothetical protein IGI04_027860 [Brassica rapa subsp. trilocularis]